MKKSKAHSRGNHPGLGCSLQRASSPPHKVDAEMGAYLIATCSWGPKKLKLHDTTHTNLALYLFPPDPAEAVDEEFKLSTMPLVDPVTMSSSIAKTSKSAALAKSKSADANPQLQPVRVNSDPLGQAVRFASPGVLVTIFTATFGNLVADPVSAMSRYLPVIGALQILYAVVCLPVAGAQSVKAKKHRPGEKKKAGDAAGPNVIVVRLSLYSLQ